MAVGAANLQKDFSVSGKERRAALMAELKRSPEKLSVKNVQSDKG